MLKAVTVVTCMTLILIYILMLVINYPYVCFIKHRPSDDDYRVSPPVIRVMRKSSNEICSKRFSLNLMPMPEKITFFKKTKIFSIPSSIKLKSNCPLPYSNLRNSSNASFILSITCSMNTQSNSYPYLGINEFYEINFISSQRAFLFAKTYVGIMRGLATFEQLQRQEKIPIPMSIMDKPRFPWRGVMLDVARHFIPISIIKQTIDHMQLVKLNVLHLHLSDDQGFRLQSKQFPRLHDSQQFYTQTDMQDLIEYARQHAIRIVPEFDMPAHTASWFVGYPNLGSRGKTNYQIAKTWGVHNATMDVTRQSTYDFLEKFFEEMTRIFPDEYFHIGGDECVPYEWMESEHIRRFIQEHNLKDHQGLQAYFTERIEKILKKFNRTMMGWDEISASNLSHQSIIHSWRDKYSLSTAIYHGHRGILSHGFYLDHMSSSAFHYGNDLEITKTLNETYRQRFLGGEACLWTEYIDSKMVHSRLWPRTAAIAERLWSPTWDSFECMYERLDQLDRTFFHPNNKQYIKDLSRFTSNVKTLKILADLCEPLGLQGRDRTRNYTSDTLLNRFVDILKPESVQTRRLIQTTDLPLLYSTFVQWKRNHLEVQSNETEILQLSENLHRLSEIGLRLVKLFDKNPQGQIVSSRWYYYQQYIFDTLEYQVPEIRLAAVNIVRNLLIQFHPCAFDLINLSLILFFPIVFIIVQRVTFVRRNLLLPCLNFCYYHCARC